MTAEVALADLLVESRSGYWGVETGERDEDVRIVRNGDMALDGTVRWDTLPWRSLSAVEVQRSELRAGDLLLTTSGNCGTVAHIRTQPLERICASNFVRILRFDARQVEARFMYHFMRSGSFTAGIVPFIRGTTLKNLSLGPALAAVRCTVPTLAEQRRIADVLDRADAIKAKRQQSMQTLDMLGQAVYDEMFGRDGVSPPMTPSSPLGELALVSSGITMGRRTTESTMRVPYVTVANVQDRRLDLRNVKTIDATLAEIERYRLASDDLLLTEGGDPDKLGRGTLWRSEIETCIHQNHVFRVRVTSDDLIDPLYLNWHVGSRRGKSYFLRSAKQTTGIASINSTQLKAFPVLLPPLGEQQRFADRIAAIDALTGRSQAHLVQLEHSITALRHRAFRGEL